MGKRKRGSKERQREAEERRASRKHSAPTPSAFDLKFQRRKHTVLNQKSKGDTGRPTQTREAGLVQRAQTLRVEFARRNKSNVFADKRFGEYDKVRWNTLMCMRSPHLCVTVIMCLWQHSICLSLLAGSDRGRPSRGAVCA